MQGLKQIFNAKYIWIYLIILCIPALWPFFQSQFFPTQDYIYVARLQQMVTALLDGHFPVRWARDLRYGEPLFNFYAPLPYYLGAVIKMGSDILQLSLSYIAVTKILFILAVIFSAFSMYLFAKDFFGKLGGVLAAVFYVYAPYHSVDIYVRGALSETWALVFFPLIFWSSHKLAEKYSKKNMTLFVLSLTGLFLTHNIMTLLFAPFIAIWMVVVTKFSIKKIVMQGVGLVWSVGLSAFYLFPAFLEKDLVQPTALLNSYYDYRAHFVAVDQLILPSWGYGPSVWGYEDGLSFQLGILHWLVVIIASIAILFGFVGFLKTKKRISFSFSFKFPPEITKYLLLFFTLLFLFGGSLFMTHNLSTPIWKNFTLLQFSQFPWRFLGVSIFFASFFAGFIFLFLKRFREAFFILLLIAVIGFNLSYFRADFYFPFTDADFVSQKELKNETKLPKDYVPQYVQEFDRPYIYSPNFTENSGIINDYALKTGRAQFTVFSETGGTVEVPIYYFEGWRAFENGKELKIAEPDKFGLIRIPVSRGTNQIALEFSNTFVRTLGNVISFISAVLLLIFISGRFRFLKER